MTHLSSVSYPPLPAMGHDFPPGSLVRLVNLNKADLNHHLGRVTVVSSNSERVGVRLHGALWQDSKDESESSKAILGIKKENLRLVPRPAPGTLLPVLDSINQRTVSRLMGESGWGLPENVVAAIATWLELRSVQPSDITVTSCSSGRGDYPISAVLNDRDDQWWISDSGSCPDGHGREYLEFSFGPEPRRVTCVAVKIPPLPYGPLSVAWVVEMMEIQLDWKSSSWMAPSWKSISSGSGFSPGSSKVLGVGRSLPAVDDVGFSRDARVRSLPTLGMSEATLGMYKKCHGRIKANGVVTSSWCRLHWFVPGRLCLIVKHRGPRWTS